MKGEGYWLVMIQYVDNCVILTEEPILSETENRFVLFPIQYYDVSHPNCRSSLLVNS